MKISKDIPGGLIFLALGTVLIVGGQQYGMGSILRMGPGYFPTMIGGLLAIIGAVLFTKALVRKGDLLPEFAWRPLGFLLLGILAFAFTLERFGLVIATVLLIIISRLAARPVYWTGTLILCGVLTGISILIFWYFLKMPFDLWP